MFFKNFSEIFSDEIYDKNLSKYVGTNAEILSVYFRHKDCTVNIAKHKYVLYFKNWLFGET